MAKKKTTRRKNGTLHQWIADNELLLSGIKFVVGIDAARSCGLSITQISNGNLTLRESGTMNQINIDRVGDYLDKVFKIARSSYETIVCIESVPSVAGYALTNRAYSWHVMAQYFGFETAFIHNGTWKSRMLGKKRGDSKNQKRLSLEIAKELFGIDFKTDDSSDAALIALYCANEISIASTGKQLEPKTLLV